jgi:hypothetical protein
LHVKYTEKASENKEYEAEDKTTDGLTLKTNLEFPAMIILRGYIECANVCT